MQEEIKPLERRSGWLGAIYILCFALLASCANRAQNIENRDLEQIYQGAGVERYFLSDLPSWANFSPSSQCKRRELTRYLNYETIEKSYSLGYEAMIHLQHMLNRRFAEFRSANSEPLYLKDEAFIFYNVYEQVAGGGRDFLQPQFLRVSVVWIDPYLNNLQQVERVLEREQVLSGHPVLASECISTTEMESMADRLGWNRFGAKFVGQEMFSPYGETLQLGHDYTLDFSKLLPGKEVRLFAPHRPPHFKGIHKFIKI